jgi:hypothetical protein
MSARPATSQTDLAAWTQATLQRQVERLEQLAEAGLRLALAIEAGATQSAEASAKAEPLSAEALAKAGMAFSRAARAVRMTALLQSRLLQEMEQAAARTDYQRRDESFRAGQAADAEAREDPAFSHKARVEAIVERVARAETDDEERLDRLMTEAAERLDDDDIYGDVLTRPVGELVALICRDLGLDPDWDRLSLEAWAEAEIAAAPPGSPFKPPPPQGAIRPLGSGAARPGRVGWRGPGAASMPMPELIRDGAPLRERPCAPI